MTARPKTGMKPSTRALINPAPTQTVEPGLVELLDSIEHLRVGLLQLTPHDIRSVDISLLTQKTLKTTSNDDDISRLFPFRSTRDTRAQLQNSENESGKIGRL